MYSIFWKSVFTSFLLIFMGVNLAFAFDLINLMNPTSLTDDYTQYYFGINSFVDAFKTYFGDGGGLRGYTDFLRNYGSFISKIYEQYIFNFKALGGLAGWSKNTGWEILSMLFGLLSFIMNIIPMTIMMVYVLMLVVYLVAFAYEIVMFVFAFFGGAFKTPLPSTDWFEYTDVWPWLLNSAHVI